MLRTVAGHINVGWERFDDASSGSGSLTVNVTLPIAVQEAEVTVPPAPLVTGAKTITEGAAVVWANGAFVAGRDGVVSGVASALGYAGVTFTVRSGDYAFVARV